MRRLDAWETRRLDIREMRDLDKWEATSLDILATIWNFQQFVRYDLITLGTILR